MATSLASLSDCIFSTAACGADGGKAAYRMEWIDRQHADRGSLQDFIADIYFKTHGARISHYCDTLLGCRDGQGRWIAAMGFSLTNDGSAFLEQYLDAPLEFALASRVNTPVSRHHIAEVGNLAATHKGAARELIIYMTRYLHQRGLVWVAFTATRALLNSFTCLLLQPVVLAQADPRRLPDAGKRWGSYYDSNPQVMFGDIRSGYARLAD